jgi:hypothetical protein
VVDTLVRPEAEVIPVADLDTTEDKENATHIVKTKPGENAIAKVTEARIYGFQIEALCGYVWVPSKDPKNHPICSKCQQIYEAYRAVNGLEGRPAE